MKSFHRTAVTFLSAATLIATHCRAQQFVLTPANPVMWGEAVSITLRELPANRIVKLAAERIMTEEWQGSKRVLYRADASFVIAADGTLNIATTAPKKGSYQGVDSRGLFWSVRRQSSPVVAAAADWLAQQVRFTATIDDKVVATSRIEFISALPTVKTEKIEKFPGAQFASMPGDGKRPAIIVLGGSEGGSFVTRGAGALASRGFLVLTLSYYSPAVVVAKGRIADAARRACGHPDCAPERSARMASTSRRR